MMNSVRRADLAAASISCLRRADPANAMLRAERVAEKDRRNGRHRRSAAQATCRATLICAAVDQDVAVAIFIEALSSSGQPVICEPPEGAEPARSPCRASGIKLNAG